MTTNSDFNTGSERTDKIVTDLYEAIKNKSVRDTKESMVLVLNEVQTNEMFSNWLLKPASITPLHKAIVEELGAHPASIKPRKSIAHRKHRAISFVKAIQNGLNRLDD